MEATSGQAEPEIGELDRSADPAETKERLLTELARSDRPHLRLRLGMTQAMLYELNEASTSFQAAFSAFRRAGDRRGSALAASWLGWLHIEAIGNRPVGRGWLSRAEGLLEGEGDCLERGWVAVGWVGCGFDDVEELQRNAELALRIARDHGDSDLEAKALGDGGLALVSQGLIEQGMSWLDEAMTMVATGEAGPMVGGLIACNLLTACDRTGDVDRLEAWKRQWEEHGRPGTPLRAHCPIAYGSALGKLGRWREAEEALVLGMRNSTFHVHQVLARSALADLRIRQGRLDEADELLAGLEDCADALGPLARLHFARGRYESAAAAARQALRLLRGDRLRSAPVLSTLVSAEIALGNLEAAADAAEQLRSRAHVVTVPALVAQAALAAGRVLAARGETAEAIETFEAGLHSLWSGEWPLIRAVLYWELAAARQADDRAGAVADARASVAIFERLDAPETATARSFLRRLESAGPGRSIGRLSRREEEVLALLAEGLSNPEIGRQLFISPKTVEHHVGSILAKLGAKTRAEAAARAAKLLSSNRTPTLL